MDFRIAWIGWVLSLVVWAISWHPIPERQGSTQVAGSNPGYPTL